MLVLGAKEDAVNLAKYSAIDSGKCVVWKRITNFSTSARWIMETKHPHEDEARAGVLRPVTSSGRRESGIKIGIEGKF